VDWELDIMNKAIKNEEKTQEAQKKAMSQMQHIRHDVIIITSQSNTPIFVINKLKLGKHLRFQKRLK
jgi:hypothetical protein